MLEAFLHEPHVGTFYVKFASYTVLADNPSAYPFGLSSYLTLHS